jgi:hypothetical protein
MFTSLLAGWRLSHSRQLAPAILVIYYCCMFICCISLAHLFDDVIACLLCHCLAMVVAAALLMRYGCFACGNYKATLQNIKQSFSLSTGMRSLPYMFWCCGVHCGRHIMCQRMAHNVEYSFVKFTDIILLYREAECNSIGNAEYTVGTV